MVFRTNWWRSVQQQQQHSDDNMSGKAMITFRNISGMIHRFIARPAASRRWYSDGPHDSGEAPPPQMSETTIPPYEEKVGEPIHMKKARLQYQSRKRGMLENGLILSAFAHRYLKTMNEEQLSMYDRLINLPSNDWEIYYWATGVRPTPQEFDNEIMTLLKEFVRNEDREDRTMQPDLH